MWHQILKFTVCENRGVTTNFCVYNLHESMTSEPKLLREFTHSEIVNYLMEFHFTIRTYIWERDTNVGSLRYVKIEVSLQIFCVYNLHEPMT